MKKLIILLALVLCLGGCGVDEVEVPDLDVPDVDMQGSIESDTTSVQILDNIADFDEEILLEIVETYDFSCGKLTFTEDEYVPYEKAFNYLLIAGSYSLFSPMENTGLSLASYSSQGKYAFPEELINSLIDEGKLTTEELAGFELIDGNYEIESHLLSIRPILRQYSTGIYTLNIPAEIVEDYLTSKFNTEVDHTAIAGYDEATNSYNIETFVGGNLYLYDIENITQTNNQLSFTCTATLAPDVQDQLAPYYIMDFVLEITDGEYKFLSVEIEEVSEPEIGSNDAINAENPIVNDQTFIADYTVISTLDDNYNALYLGETTNGYLLFKGYFSNVNGIDDNDFFGLITIDSKTGSLINYLNLDEQATPYEISDISFAIKDEHILIIYPDAFAYCDMELNNLSEATALPDIISQDSYVYDVNSDFTKIIYSDFDNIYSTDLAGNSSEIINIDTVIESNIFNFCDSLQNPYFSSEEDYIYFSVVGDFVGLTGYGALNLTTNELTGTAFDPYMSSSMPDKEIPYSVLKVASIYSSGNAFLGNTITITDMREPENAEDIFFSEKDEYGFPMITYNSQNYLAYEASDSNADTTTIYLLDITTLEMDILLSLNREDYKYYFVQGVTNDGTVIFKYNDDNIDTEESFYGILQK